MFEILVGIVTTISIITCKTRTLAGQMQIRDLLWTYVKKNLLKDFSCDKTVL